jgi:hypothetical protein
MIVQFEGQDWEFNLDDIDVVQARYIKRHTGLTIVNMEEGMGTGDPDALCALYWLMKVQNGKTTDINGVNFPILKFAMALVEAVKREEKSNPTSKPAPKSRAGQKTSG